MVSSVSSGNRIIQSADPKGHFMEGTLTAGQTPKPGQHLVRLSTGLWSVFAGASGSIDEVVIAVENDLEGKTSADAYGDIDSGVTGGHVYLYVPLPGDELLALFANISGTADSFAIGDKMMIQTATGKLIANSSGAMIPYKVQETVAALTADGLYKVRRI